MKWKSVENKPEPNQEVLITDGIRVKSATWMKRTDKDEYHFMFTTMKGITHWMALPLPPIPPLTETGVIDNNGVKETHREYDPPEELPIEVKQIFDLDKRLHPFPNKPYRGECKRITFLTSEPIPEEMFPAIKAAIEKVLNNESPTAPVEQEGQEFVWTDNKVLEFAKLYRFSSSRCSIDQYKRDFTI